MGSIDNCRVVLKTIPHFKFTDDQHDSLARLQKMVMDMDWERGLRVWNRFSHFAHPIASKPDVVPTPEELVDIVIVERKHHKDPNARRNNKKGGRGKKKERKKDNRNGGKGRSEDKANRDNDADRNENQSATADDSQTHLDKGDYVSENTETDKKHESCEKRLDESLEPETAPEVVGGISNNQECIGKPIEEDGRTRVFIKRPDPNRPEPKIEVKVLIPGPNEDAFPTQLDDKDQRHVEPMDVDLSVNVGNEPVGSSLDEGKKSASQSEAEKENVPNEEEPSKDKESEAQEKQAHQQPSNEEKENALGKIVSATRDFASSVIEKLKLSSPSSNSTLPPCTEKVCATPPSTPVVLMTDPLTNPLAGTPSQSPISTVLDPPEDKDLVNGNGSSVDPSSPTLPESVASPEGKAIPADAGEATTSSNQEPAVNLDGKSDAPAPAQEGGSESDRPVQKENKKERDPTKPTFRVTCNRVGEGHAFDSSSAAACLGSAIIKYFNWSVDLKHFDIEVLLNIDNEEVTVGIGLTKSSLHNRNLVAFGPTTLRATICYNMLRLCRIKTGDIVCDPMCGTSALPIEGALNWTGAFHFGGDYHELAMERSMKNMVALHEKHDKEKRGKIPIGLVQWNINNFPLREKCVDVFVSDLPFGHRMGSRTVNRTLYPTLLSEMARTARTGARACLLTEDKTSLIKAIQTFGRLWQRRLILSINMGGLSGFVFLLTRTTASYSVPTGAWHGGQPSDHNPPQGDQTLTEKGGDKKDGDAELTSGAASVSSCQEAPSTGNSQEPDVPQVPSNGAVSVNANTVVSGDEVPAVGDKQEVATDTLAPKDAESTETAEQKSTAESSGL